MAKRELHHALGRTRVEHAEETFYFMAQWAGKYAENRKHLQMILNDRAINRWMLNELAKAEADFWESMSIYDPIEISTAFAREMYFRRLKSIFSLYPKPLIAEVKPKPKTRSEGIEVAMFSAFNQN